MSSVPLSPRRVVGDAGWQPTLTVAPSTTSGPVAPVWLLTGALTASAAVLSAVVLVAGAVSLARAMEGRVLPGVVVAGTDLSGLSLADAAVRIRAAADDVLDARLVVEAAGTQTALTPRALGATSNAAAVAALLEADRAAVSPWGWVAMRWFGAQGPPSPSLHVTLPDPSTVGVAVAAMARDLSRDPVDATWTYDDTAIAFTPHVDGLSVDVAATAISVREAMTGMVADRTLEGAGGAPPSVAATVTVTPATTSLAQLGQVLFLDQSTHTLTLYEDGAALGEWTVATGARGFATPTGEYEVAEKRENPTWGNPAPDGWGRDLPAWIGPGPGNPLGVRAINWGGTDHIRFHGTDQEWTLGTDASHGCVRMANDDVVELFDLVHTGTPIISVS